MEKGMGMIVLVVVVVAFVGIAVMSNSIKNEVRKITMPTGGEIAAV